MGAGVRLPVAALLLIPLNWRRFWRCRRWQSSTRSPSASSRFRRPSWGSRSTWAFRWRLAVRGEVQLIVAWVMLANFFWVLAFDTEYAMVDRDDDIRIGIRTSALFSAL